MSTNFLNNPVYNWSKTKILSNYNQLHFPNSISELRSLVLNHKKVRCIGSKLTYNNLTKVSNENDSILIDIKNFVGLIHLDKKKNTAKFWAGTTIKEISETLEKNSKYFSSSTGVIGDQTFAGALGTGIHGQGLHVVPFVDTLKEAEIMLASGAIIKVDSKKKNFLDALKTHLGVFGIILTITIEISDLKIMTCKKKTISLDKFEETFIKIQRSEKYCKGWWFPDFDLVHIWEADVANEHELELYEKNGRNLVNVHQNLDNELSKSIDLLEKRMKTDTNDDSTAGKQFQTISRFRNVVNVTGTMHQVYMKGIPVPQINCEIAIPIKNFELSLKVLKKWKNETKFKLHYPFIFRCTAASEALLSPHRGEEICWIGFLVYLDSEGNAAKGSFEMMREIQQVLLPLGGMPHNGKYFDMDLYNLEKFYPKLKDFLFLQKMLDPEQKFQNEYTKKFFAAYCHNKTTCNKVIEIKNNNLLESRL
ncbi:hypothetical protein HK099_001540 [Clydaea vesicula]|uniref:D-arabinono-1,4-lactone oxidase n=1 Tax=Clydaea vesicula TaxID=447962 RepID=A0AAD5XVX9_9FUNG|nr:hypothetical protein HK099_001540 [Clydaea vesicula]